MNHTQKVIAQMNHADYQNFASLDIRVGTVTQAMVFENARRPAYRLWIDFGSELGELKSSAQVTELYDPDALVGRQVVAVVNFPPKQIANFFSECLVLGVYTDKGVVLLSLERPCANGSRIG